MKSRIARVAQLVLIVVAGLVLALAVVMALAGLLERIREKAELMVELLGVAVVLLAAAWVCGLLARRVRRGTVLELDLREPLSDQAALDPLSALAARGRPTLRDAVELFERASGDPRIAGLVAWIRTPARGLASVQELRDAVTAFRSHGKYAIAHAETFDEFAAGTGAYYLASAFDEVWLQPSGSVGLVGLAMEVDFLRGVLDKLGVDPQLDHRHEYKVAMNRFTETGFTPAHRESLARIVESLFDQVVAGVAEGRRLDPARVRALVDQAPILGHEAVEAGLVDRLAYRDELVDHAKGNGGTRLPLPAYAKRARPRRRRGTAVALILGTGAIIHGRSRPNPLTRTSMGADTLTRVFRKAIADKRVKAILFRVDSPGGSAVASEAIWRETVRAREAGKPVVVSMGDVAASGGYLVALSADRIVAHPATITGSIGVLGGKAVVAGLKAKLGITHDEVHAGAHALIASASSPFSEPEWERLQRSLDWFYDDFVQKVAAGRGLPVERVHEVAKGRGWTGADAREIGLVDELGGYPTALRAVRDALGVAPDAPVRLVTFPRRRSRLARLLGCDGHAEDVAAGLVQAGEALAPLARLVRQLTGHERVLEMPELPITRWQRRARGL